MRHLVRERLKILLYHIPQRVQVKKLLAKVHLMAVSPKRVTTILSESANLSSA